MVNKLTYNSKDRLDFHFIDDKIKELELYLSEYDIHNETQYKEWLKDFKIIYGDNQVSLRLYIAFTLLYLIGLLFVSKFILKDTKNLSHSNLTLTKLKEIETKIKHTYENHKIIEFEYFSPIFLLSERKDMLFFNELIFRISNFLFELKINPTNILDYAFQKVISPLFRHKSGEYYTPPFLVDKMVNEVYSFGEMVLDPCCGSGNFIIGIIKEIMSQDKSKNQKVVAINRIYGFDLNPISIYLSKINVLFLTKEIFSDIKLHFYNIDFLFHKRSTSNNKFDLIIGNPPWYTYRDVDSIDYQERLKSLAEELEIKPRPKNLLNLEVSTLFFYYANKHFMKINAKIFYVITKGVITGSHTSRFRNFKGFSNVNIWSFDKKIEKIFNIDFICLYAQKGQEYNENNPSKIPVSHFVLEHNVIDINLYGKLNIKLKKEEILIPFSVEKKGNKVYVKKLISKDKQQDLLPLEESYYKKLFHKGADLNPRNLIFVNAQDVNDLIAKINPDNRIFKKAKDPWNKKEFEDELVNKKYLFKVIKSTELVKFFVYNHYIVFLPLSKIDLSFDYINLDENSRRFYDKINEIYLEYKKVTTANNSLMENLNRWSKLINPRQISEIKVVYNNSGSTLNSAVIQGEFLITGDLTFYNTSNLNEAYYLSAILNSNILTKQIKIMKSSRHIFKLPFNIPIRKYDAKNPNHQQLVELGKKGQEIVKSVIEKILNKNKDNFSKQKIQNILIQELNSILNQIDVLLIEEFSL
ncbi:MAG: N-6 DNA methylase [Promethearchaeota archaeon]